MQKELISNPTARLADALAILESKDKLSFHIQEVSIWRILLNE